DPESSLFLLLSPAYCGSVHSLYSAYIELTAISCIRPLPNSYGKRTDQSPSVIASNSFPYHLWHIGHRDRHHNILPAYHNILPLQNGCSCEQSYGFSQVGSLLPLFHIVLNTQKAVYDTDASSYVPFYSQDHSAVTRYFSQYTFLFPPA